jgi:flagellar basal-body rod protein FlgC
MGMQAFDVSASALAAERIRMNVIANNLANAHTTRNVDGKLEPFKRQLTVFEVGMTDAADDNQGVRVSQIVHDGAPPKQIYDPHHPDADKEGYRQLPNVNSLVEMVDMITATRSYQANLSVIDLTKSMHTASLGLLRA